MTEEWLLHAVAGSAAVRNAEEKSGKFLGDESLCGLINDFYIAIGGVASAVLSVSSTQWSPSMTT